MLKITRFAAIRRRYAGIFSCINENRRLFSNKFQNPDLNDLDNFDDDQEHSKILNLDLYRGAIEAVQKEPDILDDPTLTEEEKSQIKLYKREYEVWKYADVLMPDRVTNRDWKLMLQMTSVRERIDHLTFLQTVKLKKQVSKSNKLAEKALVQERREKKKAESGDHIIYGQGHNTIFRRLKENGVHRYFDLRALNTLTQGPIIVFDMSFLNDLMLKEVNLTLNQLRASFDVNRRHRQPAAVVLTSFDRTFVSEIRSAESGYAQLFDDYAGVYTTRRSLIDLFPRQQLTYLTPDARKPLLRMDSERVHVIGGFVDRVLRPRLTLGRAKQLGIEARRLPLSDFVKWESGNKTLCLNHILGVLLDAHVTNDWMFSIENNVAKRKLTPIDPEKKSSFKATRLQKMERRKFLESLVVNK